MVSFVFVEQFLTNSLDAEKHKCLMLISEVLWKVLGWWGFYALYQAGSGKDTKAHGTQFRGRSAALESSYSVSRPGKSPRNSKEPLQVGHP